MVIIPVTQGLSNLCYFASIWHNEYYQYVVIRFTYMQLKSTFTDKLGWPELHFLPKINGQQREFH